MATDSINTGLTTCLWCKTEVGEWPPGVLMMLCGQCSARVGAGELVMILKTPGGGEPIDLTEWVVENQ